MSQRWGTWSHGKRWTLTLTTTRWNSPAILTCSSRRRDARSCRWGQRLKCGAAGLMLTPVRHWLHHANPPWHCPGGGVTFPELSRWKLSPASVALLLVGCRKPCDHQLLGVLQTAGGMCHVLFLCISLMGCHGSTRMPQEQSWDWLSHLIFSKGGAVNNQGWLEVRKRLVFTLDGWREASVGLGVPPTGDFVWPCA